MTTASGPADGCQSTKAAAGVARSGLLFPDSHTNQTMPFSLPIVAAYSIFLLCTLGVLLVHGIPALLAGLLSFVLTRGLLAWLRGYALPRRALSHELLAALLIGLGSLAALGAIVGAVVHFLAGESVSSLMLTIADTLQHVRRFLPPSVASLVPESLLQCKTILAGALKEHANIIAGVGTSALHTLALTLIGWLVGVLVAAHKDATGTQPPFLAAWLALWSSLSRAFRNVAFAQAKIAALNAALTGVFLLCVMPLVGWHIPYAKTLVVVTFVCGLLPIVGNLISNTLLCTVALGVAFPAALAALGFLVVVHKLEYFIAARIQGHEIGAQAWELLIVLFTFETLFGPAGMVAAPILYAFSKAELKRVGWLAK